MFRSTAALAIVVFAVAAPLGASQVGNVAVSRPFFNPSLGEHITVAFTLAEAGRVDVLIVDRDGFPVRQLAQKRSLPAGKVTLEWDGRDRSGQVVADEAWSLKIDADTASGTSTYFPADAPPPQMVSVDADSYSPAASILRYTLPVASRVHMQAGSSAGTAHGPSTDGAVMKTIVDRAPRAAGAVIEQWNGLDESGTIRVSDQPNFVVGIAATPLPENSIITIGDRSKTFLQMALTRRGKSLFTSHPMSHAHHVGLTALDDHSPSLRVAAGHVRGSKLPLTVSVEGPTASRFLLQHPTLFVFVDGKLLLKTPADRQSMSVSVPWHGAAGDHVVVVNWQSEFGPVAANALRIDKNGVVR